MHASRLRGVLLGVVLAPAMVSGAAGEYEGEDLIASGSPSILERNPLLPSPASGYAAAVYCDVPLGRAWAVAIRKKGSGEAVLELRDSGRVETGGSREPVVTVSSVSEELATAVGDAIDKLIGEAKEPEKEPVARREEATYHFIAYGGAGDARTAWTLSPLPASRAGHLVQLAGALYGLAKKPDAERAETARQLALDLLAGDPQR